MSKEAVTGVKEDQLAKQGRESLEAALGGKVEAQKAQETKKEETEVKKEPETAKVESVDKDKSQDADNELSKYDNVLMKTYGVTEEELEKGISPDKARKLAKSWVEIQSSTTKTKQEASQHKAVVDNLNAVLQKYPSLYEKLEQAAQGRYDENPQKESKEQPNKAGQLDYDVSEDELVQQGYLNAEDLQGLDELAKQRKILRAEAKYIREQESKNYMNDIKTQQENLRKQQELTQIQAENKRRAEEGFDEFVRSYGVNFAELEPEVVSQIQKKMQYTLDPSNPKLIAEDAFELAASQILRQRGLLNQSAPTPKADVSKIEDTGRTFSKASKPEGKLSMDAELRKRAYKNFTSNNDPKSKYKQVS